MAIYVINRNIKTQYNKMKTNKFYYLALAMTFGLAACNSAEGTTPVHRRPISRTC